MDPPEERLLYTGADRRHRTSHHPTRISIDPPATQQYADDIPSHWPRRRRHRYLKSNPPRTAPKRCFRVVLHSNRIISIFVFASSLFPFFVLFFPRYHRRPNQFLPSDANSFITKPSQRRCAILLHGIPRSFHTIVLPTLIQNVLRPNAKYYCDYFVHYHIREFDEKPSHPGMGGFVDATHVLKMAKLIVDIGGEEFASSSSSSFSSFRPYKNTQLVQFVNTTDGDCRQRHYEAYSKMHLLKDSKGNWLYFPEIIRSWDGMQSAWELMDSTRRRHKIDYDAVAVLRLDVALLAPMDVFESGGEPVVVTSTKENSFLNAMMTQFFPRNERDFIRLGPKSSHEVRHSLIHEIATGSYHAIKLWMTGRFNHINDYLDKLVANNPGKGFNKSAFEEEVVFPLLKSSHAIIKYDSSLCSVDVMPNNSVLLANCGNVTNNMKVLQQTIRQSNEDFSFIQIGANAMSLKQDTIVDRSHSAAVCTIVTDEEFYLDEWIDYHVGLGFSHIYIYDNSKNFDLGNGWLQRRSRLYGKMTVQYFPGSGKQMPAFKDCAQKHGHNHQWLAHFDVDEFLVLRNYSNVIPFLEKYCPMGALSINWIVQSWWGRLQYSPKPVTIRFPGSTDVSAHKVKSITRVEDLSRRVTNNPHFPLLKSGFHQRDTNNNNLENNTEPAFNLRNLTNVANFYHFETKSWKENIAKRDRGRSDLDDRIYRGEHREKVIRDARDGYDLFHANRMDSSSWETLKSNSPKYSFFDSFGDNTWSKIIKIHNRRGPAICCVTSNEEAYIDEWIYYHLSQGFSALYVIDASEAFWMKQWRDEHQSMSIFVDHYPGDIKDPVFKAKALANCLTAHQDDHNEIVLMDVNDFFILFPESGSIVNFVSSIKISEQGCVWNVERVIFGNGGQVVYEPLPVTKRFMFRVEPNEASLASVPMFHCGSTRKNNAITDRLEEKLQTYLESGVWKSNACYHADSTVIDHALVYHYLHSEKECRRTRTNASLCDLKGTVEDQFGWVSLQSLLQEYSHYNGFL